jgi:hypothetical protein
MNSKRIELAMVNLIAKSANEFDDNKQKRRHYLEIMGRESITPDPFDY